MAHADPSWAVAQTIHRLFQHLDDGEIDQVAALFAPTGVWLRQGERLIGPAGVLRALQARPRALSTRHLVSNMVVSPVEGAMAARYYVTVFAHEGAVEGPAPLGLPEAVMVLEDQLAEAPDGWRFVHRQPRVVFKRP